MTEANDSRSASGTLSAKTVGIVVLNFHNLEDTKRCIESMLSQEYSPKNVICVDNESTEDSAKGIRAAFPRITLITSEKNIGFGAGMNLGIQKALELGCDYVLCMNNDAFADDPAFVSKLVNVFRDNPRTGVAGGVELDWSGKVVNYSGPTGKMSWELKASGAAFMTSKEALGAAGIYDDRYFLGYEDHDLFSRMEKLGFEIKTIQGVHYRHKVSGERAEYIPMYVYLDARNRTIMFARYWTIPVFLRAVVWRNMKRLPRYILMFSEQRQPDVLKAYIKGLCDGGMLLPKIRVPESIPLFDPTEWTKTRDSRKGTELPKELRFG